MSRRHTGRAAGGRPGYAGQVHRRAFLLTELIRRDLTLRYVGSVGGVAWALVNPIVLCAIYTFVFSMILKIPVPEGFRGSYTEFLLAGLLPWIGIQEAVTRGSAAVTDQAHLVKKLAFPPELLVLANLGSALVLQLAAMAILAVYAGIRYGGLLRPDLLVIGFGFELLILVGPVLALAALQVLFRDLSQALGPMLMIVFYLTPILYSESSVPRAVVPFLVINPVRDVAALFRAGLFGAPAPPASRLAILAALFALVGWAGLTFFRRCRRSFSDLL